MKRIRQMCGDWIEKDLKHHKYLHAGFQLIERHVYAEIILFNCGYIFM